MILPAEFWYAYMKPPIRPIRPPVTIDGPLIPGLMPVKNREREKRENEDNELIREMRAGCARKEGKRANRRGSRR